MNSIQKRFALFLGLCIPIRVAFTILAKYIPIRFLPLLGVPFLIFGLGITTIYITGSRRNGAETMGAPIWWNSLRPVHGLLYLVFAIGAFCRNRDSWLLLLIDTLIGFVAFWSYHITKNNLTKLY